jgi:hypothetical protein
MTQSSPMTLSPHRRWPAAQVSQLLDILRAWITGGGTHAQKRSTSGRPRVAVDAARIAALRSQGLSWARLGEQLGLGEGTIRRSAATSAKNLTDAVSRPPQTLVLNA